MTRFTSRSTFEIAIYSSLDPSVGQRLPACRRRGLHARDQPLDPLVNRPEWVLAEHGALRLLIELEMYPVDSKVTPRRLGRADELTAQPGAGGLRRMVDRLRDVLVGGDTRRQALALQQIEDTAPPLDVVIGQIELGDLRVGQLHVVAVLVALEQLALDHPVDLGVHLGEILALDGVELTAPQVDDLLDLRVGLPALQVFDGAGVVLPLNVQRAGLTATGQPHRPTPGDVVADLTDGADGVVQ